ncbi:MAG TPA: DedA family protein [Casimicrobiaceae bacterium]|jgi:membrane-associated protein
MITTLVYSLFALDQTLATLAAQHAALMFAALFVVIFAETGLVIFPLLPGDSLLFVAGTVVAASGINVHLLVLTLFVAAVLGDSLNYGVGRFVGPKVFCRPKDSFLGRCLKPQYLDKTRQFYAKYGGFTIVVGRFVPIVRTFAPFLAGVGCMAYPTFICFNVLGAALWVSALTYAGYLFGNIPWVKDNLAWIVVAIVVVSLLPVVLQWLRERRDKRAKD